MSLSRTDAVRREIRILMLEGAWVDLTTNQIADRILAVIDDAEQEDGDE